MCAHSLLSRVLFSNIRLRKSKPKQGHYAKESVEVAKGQPRPYIHTYFIDFPQGGFSKTILTHILKMCLVAFALR